MAALSRHDRQAKAAAIAAGEAHYMPEKPCGHGHASPRGVNHGRCLSCAAQRRAEWVNVNREKVRAADAAAHRQRRAEKAVAEGREPVRIGRMPFLTAEQRIANRRANSLRYWRERPGLHSAMNAAHHAAKPEQTIARVAKRRARRKQAAGTFTAADIRALRLAQKDRCVLCLKPFGCVFR
ncbi:hypothetical protein M0638_27380 [Roseomonas sp. NAR14]|uniref:Uncharacterized protein n=1 Tax=Roseomonas acroporae TaxID=2937791 RepID=A0A9X2BWR6_9PROT|nr:hypothetical protein [Roseomonas acroporae]MCK8788083.1 hypothetical protein [Roseomonas acroporae]